MHEYRGVFHVHSTFSDGLAPVEKIMEEANYAQADFVVLTDHNTLRAKEEGLEGWHGRCLLLVGEEITPDTNADHYLALDISKEISASASPSANVEAVKRQGGIGFIAHPTGGAMIKAEFMEYPWTDWDAGPFDGIEIWNHTYDVTGRAKNVLQLIVFVLFPVFAHGGPVDSVLATWDYFAASYRRHIAGIGGVDAHGIMSMYRDSFHTVSTYILTPEPFTGSLSHDSALVYSALRSGRCFVGADKVDDASGFRCQVVGSDDNVIEMGGTIPAAEVGTLNVSSPRAGLIRLVHNGVVVVEQYGKTLEAKLSRPGAYRVEVRHRVCRRYLPWIFGNHVFVV